LEVQRLVCDELLQPPVLFLESLQAFRVAQLEPAEPLLPAVELRLHHAHRPADLIDLPSDSTDFSDAMVCASVNLPSS
jgi:hypothetical protein